MSNYVPLLDFLAYQKGGDSKDGFLRDLVDSFQRFGFVRLTHHGVQNHHIDKVFRAATDFFELSQDQKMKCAASLNGDPQRGYSAIGAERTASLYKHLSDGNGMGSSLIDHREHFDCGSAYDQEYPNRWPEKPDGFGDTLSSFYNTMAKCAAQVLQASEEALNVQPGTFNDNVYAEGASELRLNHYPAISAGTLRSSSISRIWPHYDLGVITLLFVSGTDGLEVWDRLSPGHLKRWVSVRPVTTYEMIVNISETLQRWTNDRLPAGLHRVQIPTELRRCNDKFILSPRYSVAFFCKANRNACVGSMKVFVQAETESYDDMTAMEYHRQRLITAYGT